MMRWFLDTEFAEDGRVIELISVSLVCEDGREYYAVSKEFDPGRCNEWVRANVLPLLPPRDSGAWKTRTEIAADIRETVLANGARMKTKGKGYVCDGPNQKPREVDGMNHHVLFQVTSTNRETGELPDVGSVLEVGWFEVPEAG